MDLWPDKEKQMLQIKDGPICGFIESTTEGKYYKFKKIPYTKPPTGTLRFRVILYIHDLQFHYINFVSFKFLSLSHFMLLSPLVNLPSC